MFIRLLAASGLAEIEFGSFVSPRWVPQLADADRLAEHLPEVPGLRLSALVPNDQGMRRAVAGGVRSVAVFTAASETFNRRNTNASIDESFIRFEPVLAAARERGIRVRGYVSTAFACPFEGAIDPARTVEVVLRLLGLGVEEVSVGDTIGVATPRQVAAFLDAAEGRIETSQIAFHFHDTRATGLVNVLTALERGVSVFDAAAGGLGGCPYAPGAGGNLATEDLLYLLHGLGIETGVDLTAVTTASRQIEREVGHPLPGKVYHAIRAQRTLGVDIARP